MVTTTTGLATSFITFTRTSNATVTDSNGFIEWAGHNLLTNSESFDASAWTKANAPTVTANNIVAPDGTTTADTIAASSVNLSSSVFQNVTLPVCTAVLQFYVRAGTATQFGAGVFSGSFASSTGQIVSGPGSISGSSNITITGLSTTVWTLVRITVTIATAGTYSILFYPDNGEASGKSVALWGAHLYRSDLGGMVLNPARNDAYYPTTPPNLLGFTEDFSNAAWVKTNILAFGSGSVANAVVAPNGLQTADLIVPNTTSGAHNASQAITSAVSGTTYIASIYVKPFGYAKFGIRENAATGAYATFNLSGAGSVIAQGSGGTGAITALSDGWYRVSMSSAAGSTSFQSTFFVLDSAYSSGSPFGYNWSGDGTSGIYLWGAQLSDSASLDAYSPVYGAAVTSAAYYAPRLDFDPVTLAARGLLVEEQRTNAVTYSSDFTQWTDSGATVTSNSVIAPDGTQTADELARATSQSDARYFTVSFTGDGSKALSFYVKYNTSPTFTVFLYDTTVPAGRAQIQFGFTAGVPAPTVTTQGSVEAIEAVGGGWYRIKVVATGVVAANTNRFYLYPAQAGSTDGQKTTFWGAQAEAQTATFSTSLIPTNGATATRTADVASVSTQAFPYSSTAGSIVVNADTYSFVAIRRNVQLDDGTASERMYIGTSTAAAPYAVVVDGGSTQADLTASGTLSTNTPYKLALAYNVNDFAACGNGGTVATDTSGNVPTVNTMRLGSTHDSLFINGHIRQVTYIPRRLSNSELQARTA